MKQEILEQQLESPFREEMRREEDRSRWQFGIRDLFGLMTAAAIGLAVGKIVTQYDPLPSTNFDYYVMSFSGILASGSYALKKAAKIVNPY